MGLKADLIRLQREEVALKVATLAAKRIQLEKKPITPIPTKTVTRLLEAASLEQPDDKTMIHLWANLLASSAIGAQNNVPRYVSILSDINGQQARLIQNIMTKQGKIKSVIDAELLLDDLWNMDQAGILLKLRQTVTKITVNGVVKAVREHVDVCGVATSDIIVNKEEEQWDGNKGLFPVDRHKSDFEILESLSLIKDVSFKDVPFGQYELSVFFYRVTHLCVEMFSACNPNIIKYRENETSNSSRRHIAKSIVGRKK
jgi:hypothetical protein